jgi:hypothetical protein
MHRKNTRRLLLRATATAGVLVTVGPACSSPAMGSIGVTPDGGSSGTRTSSQSTTAVSSTTCSFSNGSLAIGPDGCPLSWPYSCPVTQAYPQCTGSSSSSSVSTTSTTFHGVIVMPPDGGDGG